MDPLVVPPLHLLGLEKKEVERRTRTIETRTTTSRRFLHVVKRGHSPESGD
jgi:hypothetical protein